MYMDYLIEDKKLLKISFVKELLSIVDTSKNKLEAYTDAAALIRHYNTELNLSTKDISELLDGLEKIVKEV